MKIKLSDGTKRELNNVETLEHKTGVRVHFLYNIAEHGYIGTDRRQHFTPAVRTYDEKGRVVYVGGSK